MDTRVERLWDPCSDDFLALLADSERSGVSFLRRLVDDWANGLLVGVCGLSVDPYGSNLSLGRVRHLYVATGYRRRGLGRRLVEEVVRVARDHFVTLRLRTSNLAAARLYEALGFRRGCDDPDHTHVMTLR